MTGSTTLQFSSKYQRRIWKVVTSLVLMEDGDWTLGVWEVWATTPDGARFRLADVDDENGATYRIQAYEGQIAAQDHDVAGWARSKGFDELAAHLSQLANS